MSVAPNLDGDRPDGGEAIGELQSLTRSYVNAVGQTIYTDTYFDLSGLTYTTGALGTEGVNFYRTSFAYTHNGWQNKTVTSLGTISRTEFDAASRSATTGSPQTTSSLRRGGRAVHRQ
jgi:hypothetical protein